MSNSKRIDRLEMAIEGLEDKLDSLLDGKDKFGFTEVKVKFKDKKKNLIFCNRCLGTGKEDDRYGGKRKCYLCEGKGYLKLKAV